MEFRHQVNIAEISIKKPDISVIIPVYNEVDNVRPLAEAILKAMSGIKKPYEIIFIDDGSKDGTHRTLRGLTEENQNIKAIRFRRNYGQTAAMAAGFDHAAGEIIISMDGDMQNDPSDIPRMISKLEEGFDVVSGWRKNRKDAIFARKIPSILANKLISKLTGIQLHDYGCSLKVYKAEIAKEVPLYGEMHRFIPALAAIEGANIAEIPVKHHVRKFGKSKYNIFRASKVILDLFTVVFLRKFITRPLHMFGKIGILSFITGFIISTYLAFQKIAFGIDIGDRPLLLLGVLLILTGIQFISTGIVAEILIRIYYESQNKAIYKIKEIYSNKGSNIE